MRKPRTPNFVVFRTVEGLLFAAPVAVAFLQAGRVAFVVTLLVCMVLYGFWTRFFKRRLTEEQLESYEAVYEDHDKIRVYRLSELFPWPIWVAWIGALIYTVFL